jgi:hypothetical protein
MRSHSRRHISSSMGRSVVAVDEVLEYRYARSSQLGTDGLSLAVTGEPQVYFRGFLEHPDVAAAALLVVARVARTRFFTTSQELRRLLDPVVTSEPGGLHAESFSGCCGVHAHFEIEPSGLDAEIRNDGTVNVDVNEPLRAALARIRSGEPLRMEVGHDAIEVRTLDGAQVERRVPLPDRWARGFAEVQMIASSLPSAFALDGAQAQRFLQALPCGRAGQANVWVRPGGGGARIAATAGAGAVSLSAPERLRVLDPLARHITALRVHAHADLPGSSIWIAELADARLILTLSPERTRGFSGEGGLLFDLASARAEEDAAVIEAQIGRRWRFGADDLAASGLTADRMRCGLTWLGAHGHIAHDPRRGEWFRRELPFPSAALRAVPPRLRDARKLVDAGAVAEADAGGERRVISGARAYHVRLDPPRCTCSWWYAHPGDRGPCKHLLAASIVGSRTSDSRARGL